MQNAACIAFRRKCCIHEDDSACVEGNRCGAVEASLVNRWAVQLLRRAVMDADAPYQAVGVDRRR